MSLANYLYLSLDLFAISIPLAFSFHPKLKFVRKWPQVWPALITTAIIFMVWDELFTQMGVWGFNARYLIGIYFGRLPLEEILFFICIPYACLFTYEVTNYFLKKDIEASTKKNITLALVTTLFVIGILNVEKWYTATTFTAFAVYIASLQYVFKVPYLGRFYVACIFILIPFFIINGILTGSFIDEEVVWYNDHENLGIRVGTIPVEDIFYGALMVLMSISVFEWLQLKKEKRA